MVILVRIFGGILFLICVWIILGWAPEAQVLSKTEALLEATSERNWDQVGRMVSEGYRDDWGFDRGSFLSVAAEAGRQFFVLDIRADGKPVVRNAGDGRMIWSGRIRFAGRGNALGEAMLSRASFLREEFELTWRQESWKPWDWKLVFVGQPELRFDAGWLP